MDGDRVSIALSPYNKLLVVRLDQRIRRVASIRFRSHSSFPLKSTAIRLLPLSFFLSVPFSFTFRSSRKEPLRRVNRSIMRGNLSRAALPRFQRSISIGEMRESEGLGSLRRDTFVSICGRYLALLCSYHSSIIRRSELLVRL